MTNDKFVNVLKTAIVEVANQSTRTPIEARDFIDNAAHFVRSHDNPSYMLHCLRLELCEIHGATDQWDEDSSYLALPIAFALDDEVAERDRRIAQTEAKG